MDLYRQIVAYMRKEAYKPMTFEELAGVFKGEERKTLLRALEELEARGSVVRTRHERYGVPEKMNLVVGKVQGHSHGYAFLLPQKPDPASWGEGDEEEALPQPVKEDVFLPPTKLNGAMHNDRVIVRLQGRGGVHRRPEGEVIRILERANRYVVGTFESRRKISYVIPDDARMGKDIVIPRGQHKRAISGEKVVVEITEWPERNQPPVGRIHALIGKKGDPSSEVEAILWKYKLPQAFPPAVEKEAAKFPETFSPEEIKGRKDLRGLTMVTIDGEDAKDLDDAVSLEITGSNYRLGVHIADVSYYVREGSALDKEAYSRATSAYLVDRVLPMLPPYLSNNLCSLNPHIDRLAMSVVMDIDKNGRVKSYDISPSVININERMTYTAVRKILVENDEELTERYGYLVETFKNMEKLALLLKEKRRRRGSIDFSFPEEKVIIDDEGFPVEIQSRESSIAEQVIEEFMLAANETVAEHFYWLQVPFLYRVHEEPSGEKISALNEFMQEFGYSIKTGKGTSPDKSGVAPKDVQALVEKVAGRPEERAVNTVILRSMKQARYAPDCLGHFGLAAKYYCHFTSPIRRYPDLVIHRVIREVLAKGGLSEKRKDKLAAFMPGAAQQSSERERAAMEAERESVDLAKTLYMRNRIGEEYDGVISGVTSFGFFVELPNMVEGLVHITTLLDDFYIYEENKIRLVGRHSRRIYRLGDKLRVRVVRADIEKREIDFELLS